MRLARQEWLSSRTRFFFNRSRKDALLELMNEAGQVVLAYKIYRCWVSEYVALPALNADSDAVAIQSIRLENEGWERDTSVTEPKEPG